MSNINVDSTQDTTEDTNASVEPDPKTKHEEYLAKLDAHSSASRYDPLRDASRAVVKASKASGQGSKKRLMEAIRELERVLDSHPR